MMPLISAGSWITAITAIVPPQFGQRNGLTSKTLVRSLTIVKRDALGAAFFQAEAPTLTGLSRGSGAGACPSAGCAHRRGLRLKPFPCALASRASVIWRVTWAMKSRLSKCRTSPSL